jgi:hypothetical protein
MITEIANTLLITFIVTEFASTSSAGLSFGFREEGNHARKNRVFRVCGAVILINCLDRITSIANFLREILETLWHIPKVLFAAAIYLTALYVDCKSTVAQKKQHRTLGFQSEFLPRVAKAFCRILPVYPIAAVLISFGFLFVINLFEALHIPTDILNWPIYYGTLYGPFSYIYFTVKSSVIQEMTSSLPTIVPHNHPQRLGGK